MPSFNEMTFGQKDYYYAYENYAINSLDRYYMGGTCSISSSAALSAGPVTTTSCLSNQYLKIPADLSPPVCTDCSFGTNACSSSDFNQRSPCRDVTDTRPSVHILLMMLLLLISVLEEFTHCKPGYERS